MAVVFLDVDGVLNTSSSVGRNSLEREPLEHLATLLQQSSAMVVVSSTWRQYPDLMRTLQHRLAQAGCPDASRNLQQTPALSPEWLRHAAPSRQTSVRLRCEEILAWVKERDFKENWVVLDDLELGGVDADVGARHVQVDDAVGLTREDVETALKLLADGPRQQDQEKGEGEAGVSPPRSGRRRWWAFGTTK